MREPRYSVMMANNNNKYYYEKKRRRRRRKEGERGRKANSNYIKKVPHRAIWGHGVIL